MNIISVIPQNSVTGLNSTIITAFTEGPESIQCYTYNHAHGLIHDPIKPYHWLGWNGGTLTEAIQFIIAL